MSTYESPWSDPFWDFEDEPIDHLKESDVQETMDFEETKKVFIEGKAYIATTNVKHPLVFVKPVEYDPPLEQGAPRWVSYKIHYSVSLPSGNLKFKGITYGTETGKVPDGA